MLKMAVERVTGDLLNIRGSTLSGLRYVLLLLLPTALVPPGQL